MKTNKLKLILLFIIVIFTFCACTDSSNDNSIVTNTKNIIDEDLSDNISINKCLYNEESNAVYVKFNSNNHGDDEAILLNEDKSVFYKSTYLTIKDDDYDKIIEYGDYTIMMYQIESHDDDWIEIESSN